MQKESGFVVNKVRSLKYLKGLETQNSNAFATVFSHYQYSFRKQLHATMRQFVAMSLVYVLSAGLVFYPLLTNFTKVLADPTTQVTITSNVVNSFGGTAVAGDFTVTFHGLNINGTSANTLSFPGSASGVTVNLDAGIYFVTTTGPSGYSSVNGANCFGNITTGDVKSCTVTSSDQQAQVQVVTQVINSNGGVKTPADFTFNVTGTNASPAAAPGNASGTMVTINSGAYSISEPVLPGYTQGLSADCTGTLASGEVKFCTITNSDVALPTTASLNVINNVINTNGGTSTPANFTASITGSTTPSSFTTSASGTPVIVQPGAYGVSVSGPSNYTFSYSVDCFATVIAGDSKTCTVTSQDVAVPTTSDISITNIVSTSTPSAGDNVTYTLTAVNNGLADATNVIATDTLPSGLTFVSSVAGQGTYNSSTGVWTIGNLANGASATLTLSAKVNIATGGQTILNSAVIGGDQPDPVSANNSASSSLTVSNLAPVLSAQNPTVLTSSSITITWTTDHPATSRVIYDTVAHPVLGAGPNYGYPNSTVEDSTLVLNHSVTVTGLSSNVVYYLRPVSHGSPEAVGGEIFTSTAGGGSGGGGGSFGGSGSGSGSIVSAPVVTPAVTPVVNSQTTPQGLAFDPNAQGQVLGASTNIPSAKSSALPKTGVPPQGLLLLLLGAVGVGVVRFKYYKI